MFMFLPTNFAGRCFKKIFMLLTGSRAGRPVDEQLQCERAMCLLPRTTRPAHVIFFWQNQARSATIRLHEGDPRNIAGRRCFVSNDALDGGFAGS
jgi:hypothetical protein